VRYSASGVESSQVSQSTARWVKLTPVFIHQANTMAQYSVDAPREQDLPRSVKSSRTSPQLLPGAKIGLLGLNGSGNPPCCVTAGVDKEYDGEVQHSRISASATWSRSRS
jgi:hypothetical protein